MSTATVSIMVLALFVVSSVMVLGNVADTFIADLKGKVDISVYFKESADESAIKDLQYAIEAKEEVREVEYVSKDNALSLFKERHKDNELLMASLTELNANPFQASLNIKAYDSSDFEGITSYIENSSSAGIIEKINFKENEKVISRLSAITSSIERIGLFFAFALSAIAILITLNTLRLVIYNYREEISVMKLVGASDWFIRGPFIITGALYGLAAGLLTWLIVFLLLWLVSGKIGSIFPGTDVFAYWAGNFFGTTLFLITFGAALGALSSFIAIRKHLKI